MNIQMDGLMYRHTDMPKNPPFVYPKRKKTYDLHLMQMIILFKANFPFLKDLQKY